MFKKLFLYVPFVLVLGLVFSEVSEAGLVGWWKLDDGSGTITADSAGDNPGTLIGDPIWVEGVLGGALEFDGDGDYVDCGNDDAFNPTGSFSFTIWAYIANWETGWAHCMFSKGGDNDRGGWSIRRFEDETLDFTAAGLVGDGSGIEGENHNISGNTPPPLNEWVHIACTYEVNEVARIYINGEIDRERVTTGTVVPNTNSVYIGTRGNTAGTGPDDWGSSFFTGKLDDARFYNHAISADDVLLVMEGGQAKPASQVSNPAPANGAVDVPRDAVLSWRPGETAEKHDIYFGTNFDDVNEAGRDDPRDVLVVQDYNELTYKPDEILDYGVTYYWRIDGIKDGDPNSPWIGDVWSFQALNYPIVIDDFEDYNDYPPTEIFMTWVDGYGNAANGSTAGYPAPDFVVGEHYMEDEIVHSGGFSMPLFYDNSAGIISEVTRSFSSSVRDWTREGVEELGLWFRGYPATVGSFTEGPAGTYTMTGSGSDIWGNSDEFHFAFKRLTGTGTMTAKVVSVQETHGWAKAAVMIRNTLEPDSRHAMMALSPVNGVSMQRRTSTGGTTNSTDLADILPPQWIRIERMTSGSFIASYSADGSSWTRLDSVDISMSNTVFIGLAVTSHDSGAACEAVFSNVSIEGNVSQEPWEDQDIGIISNIAEPMYVALNGNAVVYNYDPNAALINGWTLWKIPLQEFADKGVNLTNVGLMTIGFGNRENPTAGGEGLVFFDDIRLYFHELEAN
jgi:hypothetical protein